MLFVTFHKFNRLFQSYLPLPFLNKKKWEKTNKRKLSIVSVLHFSILTLLHKMHNCYSYIGTFVIGCLS